MPIDVIVLSIIEAKMITDDASVSTADWVGIDFQLFISLPIDIIGCRVCVALPGSRINIYGLLLSAHHHAYQIPSYLYFIIEREKM